MTALLKEVEEARGGVVSTSYIADDGRDMDEMDAAITSSAEVISKRLTTFRSVREGCVACMVGVSIGWVGGGTLGWATWVEVSWWWVLVSIASRCCGCVYQLVCGTCVWVGGCVSWGTG